MAEQSNQPGIKDLYKVLSDIEQRHDAEVKRLTEEKQQLETSLKNEIETRTEQSKRLQNVQESLTEHKKIISSALKEQENLQQELKEKTDEVTRLHYAKRDVELSIDVYVQDNQRLIVEAADLRHTSTKQNKRIEELIKDFKAAKQETAQLQSTLIEKENLQQELNKKTDEVTSLHYAKRDVELSIDVYVQDNKRLIVEAGNLRHTLTKQNKRIEELIKDIKAAKQETAQLQRKDTAYKKTLKEAEQKLTRTETAYKKTLQEAEQKLTRTATAYKEKLQEAGEILIRLQSELAIALKDRDDYQVRLSALMSTKLPTYDPGITDLSDINRPTKLAERWSELYDNEYTDLFEALQCEDEKKISLILKLLKRSFEICQEIREQGVDWFGYCSENNTMHNPLPKKEEKGIKEPLPYEDPVDHEDPESASSKGEKNERTKESRSKGEPRDNGGQDSASSLGDKNADDEQNDQVHGRRPSFSQQQSTIKIDDNQKQTIDRYSQTAMAEMVKLDVPDELKSELMKELSPYRKKKALEFVDILNKALPERIAKEFDIAWNTGDALDMYLKFCIRLCWLMGIQSPPVYICFDEQDQTTRHAKLDKHFYREHTKAGQYIDYVVWPPLFLYKDGPLLHRGVAQGTNRKD